jgi:tetratricopeptide (TPR) repeat protein
VLNKVMEAYIAQKKWDEAIKAMGKIEDYETDPEHRARLHYTAAVILRDELGRPKDAAWHLDQALVKDPTHRKAFEALKRLYNEQKNFKGLAKAYRLMLQRLPETTPVAEQVRLWHELGEICQDKLQDAKGAIVAFEVAAKLNPSDEARQERLAQLYITAGPDAYEKAILANQRRLQSNPLRQEAYKELRRLYAEIGSHDKAWCVSAVLSLLKKASEEESALYQKHRQQKPRRLARKLSADLWRDHLFHKRQSPLLNEAFAAAAPIMTPMAVRPHKAIGGEALNLAQETRPYARVGDYIGQVLDRQPSGMILKATIEQGRNVFPVLVGSAADQSTVLLVHPRIVKNESVTELHYWFTKGMAMMRPEHTLGYITPSSTVLRAIGLAMLKVVRPSTRLAGDVDQILRLVDVFKADLAPNKLDLLADRADELRQACGEQGIEDWMEAVDLTVTRAAMLVCDDLETAARLVATEATPMAGDHDAVVKRRLQELMVFAVSESYFKLREVLGLQVG